MSSPDLSRPATVDLLLLTADDRLVATFAEVHIAGTSAQQLTQAARQAAASAVAGREVWLLHDGGAPMGRRDLPVRFEVLSSERSGSEKMEDEGLHPDPPVPAPLLLRARPWQLPGWHRQVMTWISTQIGERVGPLAWVHTSDVGAVLTAQTRDGDVYLKASEHGREARSTLLIAAQLPALTPDLLAADPERSWLLTRHAGSSLLNSSELTHWQEAVRNLALFQTQAQLEGMPVHMFARLPQQVHTLLAPEVMTHWGLSDTQQTQIQGLLPRLLEVHARVAALDLPDCACHGDFHANNVLVEGERARLFDWPEACIAHPLTDIGWFLAFIMHPMRDGLKLRREQPELAQTLWTLYLQASGIQTDLSWQDAALLALFHRAVAYDRLYRQWTGTLPGFRPQYTPYALKMARRIGSTADFS